jgi:hypothetical protein
MTEKKGMRKREKERERVTERENSGDGKQER